MPERRLKGRQLDIVAIGASAGGVEALSGLLRHFPRQLPAAVLVVLHRPSNRTSHLRQILSRETTLPLIVPRDGETLRRGCGYIGAPDRHLIVGADLRMHLLPDHFYRGHNIDILFFSLARHAGNRTIGVVLSGMLKDGALGLKAIKEAGGVALVQSPQEATFPEMPESAIRYCDAIDFVGPVHALAKEICRLVGQDARDIANMYHDS